MHDQLNLELKSIIKEGVIYHSFSDLSGTAFFNGESNEVLNLAASEEAISLCYMKYLGESVQVDEYLYAVVLSLVEKGLLKTE